MQDPLSGLPAMLLQRGGAARGAPPEPAEPATTVADFLGADSIPSLAVRELAVVDHIEEAAHFAMGRGAVEHAEDFLRGCVLEDVAVVEAGAPARAAQREEQQPDQQLLETKAEL